MLQNNQIWTKNTVNPRSSASSLFALQLIPSCQSGHNYIIYKKLKASVSYTSFFNNNPIQENVGMLC